MFVLLSAELTYPNIPNLKEFPLALENLMTSKSPYKGVQAELIKIIAVH